MLKLIQKRWFYHSVPWLFITVTSLLDLIKNEPQRTPTEIGLMIFSLMAPTIGTVYAHFYFVSRFLEKKQYLKYVLGLLLVIAAYVFTMVPAMHHWGHTDHTYEKEFYNSLVMLAVTTGARYIKRGIQNRFRMQELEAKTARNELNALKAQINPHFLFNTLNNIYAVNQTDPARGSEMILELAEVLVYHMGQMQKENLPLEEEAQLIESYIVLEKLRLNDNCQISVELKPENPKLEIAPLLLMPFIENAFKHGTHPTKPCFVHVKLENQGKSVIMEVKNSVIKDKKVVKTNIGLENTRRRLELVYPNKHVLDIQNNGETHSVNLILQT